jgi:hypothetical protein
MLFKERDVKIITGILQSLVVARISESTLMPLRDVVYLEDVLRVIDDFVHDQGANNSLTITLKDKEHYIISCVHNCTFKVQSDRVDEAALGLSQGSWRIYEDEKKNEKGEVIPFIKVERFR